MRLAGVIVPESTLLRLANKKELEKALEKRGTTKRMTEREQFDKLLVDIAISCNKKSVAKGA